MYLSTFNRILERPYDVPASLQGPLNTIMTMIDHIARDAYRDIIPVAANPRAALGSSGSGGTDSGHLEIEAQTSASSTDGATSGIEAESAWFARASSVEAANTIALLGERGVGKTTLLYYICAQLRAKKIDIVLPIVRPDRFGERDTLSGAVLAALQKTLETERQDVLDQTRSSGTGASVEYFSNWLDRVRRQEALVQRGFGERLPGHQLSSAEFATEAVQVNTAGTVFAGNWSFCVDWLLNYLDSKRDRGTHDRPPLLIIPIDDADLKPSILPDLFADLRRLTTHPGVVVLFSGSEAAIENEMIADFHDVKHLGTLLDEGFIDRSNLLEDVHRFLEKALPSHLRVELPHLSEEERLAFTPIGEEEPLLALMKRTPVKAPKLFRPVQDEEYFPAVLSDFFIFPIDRLLSESNAEGYIAKDLTMPYVNCLSPRPRELEHLYRHMKNLLSRVIKTSHDAGGNESEVDERVIQSTIQAVIEHGISHSEALVPHNVRSPIRWHSNPTGIAVEFDFRDMSFGRENGRGLTIRDREIGSLHIRNSIQQLNRLYSRRRSEQMEDDTEERQGTKARTQNASRQQQPQFPGSFTYSVYLAAELTSDRRRESVFEFEGQFASLATPGGEAWTDLLQVRIGGARSNGSYWLVPNWDNHYDYFLYRLGWNRMIDLLRDLADSDISLATSLIKDDTLIEFALLVHLDLVCRVQASRVLPLYLWQMSVEDLREKLNTWMTDHTNDVGKQLKDIYNYCVDDGVLVRDQDFLVWFEIFLPWATDRNVASEKLSAELMKLREEIIRKDRAESADHGAANHLAQRIRRNLTADWIPSAIEVVRHLIEDLADRLIQERSVGFVQLSETFQGILQNLERAQVPEELLARLRLFGLTPEMALHEGRQLALGKVLTDTNPSLSYTNDPTLNTVLRRRLTDGHVHIGASIPFSALTLLAIDRITDAPPSIIRSEARKLQYPIAALPPFTATARRYRVDFILLAAKLALRMLWHYLDDPQGARDLRTYVQSSRWITQNLKSDVSQYLRQN